MPTNVSQHFLTDEMEALKFQHTDWPLLQSVMAFIRTSGTPYTEWDRPRIAPLINLIQAAEDENYPLVVKQRVCAKAKDLCRMLIAFPSERDAELEWVYQLYANGSSEIDNLPRFYGFKRSSGPVFESQLKAIKEYACLNSGDPKTVPHPNMVAVRAELAELKKENSRLSERFTELEGENQAFKSRLDALQAHVDSQAPSSP